MKKYLGFIEARFDTCLHLAEEVRLPFYGGVVATYNPGSIQNMEYVQNMIGEGDNGFLVVALSAETSELLKGHISGKLQALSTAMSMEEATQLYCRIEAGLLSLNARYCGDELPAAMWAGTAVCPETSMLYISVVSDWDMQIADNIEVSDEYPYIVTTSPVKVIERRGVDILGRDWIEDTWDALPEELMFKKSKIWTGHYICGNNVLTEAAYKKYINS